MIRNLIVNINSDRSVFPKELKVANRYEIKTNVLNIKFSFDLPENSFVYLVLTRNQIQYYYPLINNLFSFDSNETWINGGWIGYVLISKAEIIDGVVNSSEALFISDAFGLTIGDSEFNIEKLEQQELPAQLHLLYDDLLHLKAELEELIRNGDFSDLSITVDSALSKTSENPVQNKVITSEINKLKESIEDLPTGGGISTKAKNLLITILRNALFNTNQSDNITELESALGTYEPDVPVEPDEPEEPDTPVEPEKIYYTITNSLTNVSNSNSVSSILENSSYSATLSANSGYTIETVSITMGGIDVTSSVYANGKIIISKVTGNIVIVATAKLEDVVIEQELITDGLLGYFDLRTAEYNNSYQQWNTTITPTQGSGQLFASSNQSIAFQDEKGIHANNPRIYYYAENGDLTASDLGAEYTFVMLSYGHVSSFNMQYINVQPLWAFKPKYKNTSNSEVALELESGANFNNDSCLDYNFCVARVNGSDLTMIMDTSRKDYDGTSISDFSSWVSTPTVGLANQQTEAGKYMTACAFYDRALSDVEIEEMRAFFKTLEVA